MFLEMVVPVGSYCQSKNVMEKLFPTFLTARSPPQLPAIHFFEQQ